MALTFYDAACFIEQAESMSVSREDQLRIDELFSRAFDNIIELRATPLKTFGRRWSTVTDTRTLMLALPVSWGVSIHRKPAQSGEKGMWTCQISMTINKEMASTSNTVAGRAPTMDQAFVAAILRVGQHLEANRLTDPGPAPGPMVA
jgi:hypothetical protein